MDCQFEEINEIVNFNSWSKKRKIYELFNIDYNMYINMSKYLNPDDMLEIKNKSTAIRRAISKIDCDIEKHFVFSVNNK
jgi:hypothetical protein